jgi:hypothetical protein
LLLKLFRPIFETLKLLLQLGDLSPELLLLFSRLPLLGLPLLL